MTPDNRLPEQERGIQPTIPLPTERGSERWSWEKLRLDPLNTFGGVMVGSVLGMIIAGVYLSNTMVLGEPLSETNRQLFNSFTVTGAIVGGIYGFLLDFKRS